MDNEKRRLFIGTFIDRALFESLFNDIRVGFDYVCTGKWVELENLHFTYKFLGNVDLNKIPEILNSAGQYFTAYNSPIELKGLGAFPNPFVPKILFAKMFNPDSKIIEMQKKIDNELEKLGFEKERRRFAPHLTLRRIKSYRESFKEALASYKELNIGIMPEFTINLIESRLSSAGPAYTIIQ